MAESKIIIVATGGLGREALWAARESREGWAVTGFLDDDDGVQGQSVCDVPVLGRVDDWHRFADHHFLVAIGAPRSRQAVVRRMMETGNPRFGTVVHRSAALSDYVSIGEGSLICANVSITTQIKIGRHVVVDRNSTIGHDTELGDFCTLAPLVACSGTVVAGPGAQIGTGACIRQGLTLGQGCMIGMGSTLTKDVPANSLWLGNPATERRRLDEFLL